MATPSRETSPFAMKVIDRIIEIENPRMPTGEQESLLTKRTERISQLDSAVQSLVYRIAPLTSLPDTEYGFALGELWRAKLGTSRSFPKGLSHSTFNAQIFVNFDKTAGVSWYERSARKSPFHKYEVVRSFGTHKAESIVKQILQIEGVRDRTELPTSAKEMVDQIVVSYEDRSFCDKQTQFADIYRPSSTGDEISFLCNPKGDMIGYERNGIATLSIEARTRVEKYHGMARKEWPKTSEDNILKILSE